jgi:hypothetical protein
MDTIEDAAEFWGCNKTRALLLSADLAPRLVPRVERVLDRDDLTPQQKREIAETLSIPGTLAIDVETSVDVDLG